MIADGKEITQDKGKNHFLNAVPSFFLLKRCLKSMENITSDLENVFCLVWETEH